MNTAKKVFGPKRWPLCSGFRGLRGDLVKLLWHDGGSMSLYAKRVEAGKFIWPKSGSGEAVQISAAQLDYLLEGIDWRNRRLRIPEDPPIHSDNMRPPVPGYSPTFDAWP